MCRGAEPLITTFSYRGPGTFDEAQQNFVAATEALDCTREQLEEAQARLDSALLSNRDLHDALAMPQTELLGYQRSYRASREDVWELEDELNAVAAKLRATYAAHAEQGRLDRTRTVLVGMGGGQVSGIGGRSVEQPDHACLRSRRSASAHDEAPGDPEGTP